MCANPDDGNAWLQCGKTGVKNLPEVLNLEHRVHHPFLYLPAELEPVLRTDEYTVCEICGGLLVNSAAHNLYQHKNNTAVIAKWNPEKQSLEELARMVADEQVYFPSGGGSNGSNALSTEAEMQQL